jgi:hypothetical protein
VSQARSGIRKGRRPPSPQSSAASISRSTSAPPLHEPSGISR